MPNPALAIHCYSDDKSGNNTIKDNIVVGEKNFCGINLLDENNKYLGVNEQDFPAFFNPTTRVQFRSVEDFKNYFGLNQESPAKGKGWFSK